MLSLSLSVSARCCCLRTAGSAPHCGFRLSRGARGQRTRFCIRDLFVIYIYYLYLFLGPTCSTASPTLLLVHFRETNTVSMSEYPSCRGVFMLFLHWNAIVVYFGCLPSHRPLCHPYYPILTLSLHNNSNMKSLSFLFHFAEAATLICIFLSLPSVCPVSTHWSLCPNCPLV